MQHKDEVTTRDHRIVQLAKQDKYRIDYIENLFRVVFKKKNSKHDLKTMCLASVFHGYFIVCMGRSNNNLHCVYVKLKLSVYVNSTKCSILLWISRSQLYCHECTNYTLIFFIQVKILNSVISGRGRGEGEAINLNPNILLERHLQ